MAGLLLCSNLRGFGQEIDSVAGPASRSAATIAEEIKDPDEKSAFVALLEATDPAKMLAMARSFLLKFPRSAFLTFAAEAAARSSFDLGDLKSGLDYAHLSLSLLPENPLLLVAVADVQAVLGQNEPAIASARDALDYLDRFDHPTRIAARDWPAKKRELQGTAWFVIGRALENEATQAPAEVRRLSLMREVAPALEKARALKPADMEIRYLLGVAYLYAGDRSRAAIEFAAVYRHSPELASRAREQLSAIYLASKPGLYSGLDAFVASLPSGTDTASPVRAADVAAKPLSAYAGSKKCEACHADIYRRWSQSGMAKMLRPYEPGNVIGDFEKENEFYAGDDFTYRNGELRTTPGKTRTLLARMVLRGGRHYFNIKESDGRWHLFPVDYTIGSKWQQAYATRSPDGQIHVFPIQYSVIEKKWLNYWKLIDAPGSERANPGSWEKLDASTSYQLNCAVCHTSQLRNTVGGSLTPDNLVFREPGVGCEMCHGPSAAHIEKMAAANFSSSDPLDPPVDFKRISNRQFVAICAQCHMQSNPHKGGPHGELNYSSTGSFFLENKAVPLSEFTRAAFLKDGRLNQATFMVEALERSQCFRKGQASCGSCHDPHGHEEPANLASLKFKDQPDLMCTGCHSQFQDQARAATHTHHPPGAEASRCVSCHMPRIMNGMLVPVRSHQIDDIPNAEKTERFGQQESPNACLLCHTEKTSQWVQVQLDSWKPR